MPTTIATGYRRGFPRPRASGKMVRDVIEQPPRGDVLSELASQLSAVGGLAASLEPLDLAGRAKLLRIARDVAHATERQNAPLAAFLIGRFVEGSVRSGVSPADALDAAASVVRSLIGEDAD
jgi:hypothetical protein